MKKLILFIASIFAFAFISAQDPVVEISTKIANQASYVTGYASEFKLREPGSDLTWTASCFNNNNSGWNNIRCGSKSAATTATITTDFAISDAIHKVEVDVERYKTGSSNKMTSMSLFVSTNADMSDAVEYPVNISGLPSSTGVVVTLTVDIDAPAENMYYRLSVDMPKVSSEGVFAIDELRYYGKALTEEDGYHIYTFDFSDATLMQEMLIGDATVAPGGEYSESATNNLDGASFSNGVVKIAFEKAGGSITPRWWESKVIKPEVRFNPGNVMTLDVVRNGYRLHEVKFVQGTSDNTYYGNLDATIVSNIGSETLDKNTKIWSDEDGEPVNSLQFVFVGDYSRCCAIRVICSEDENALAGIENIASDSLDNDADVEYYNLQGIRIDADNVAPGIYIRRRGTSSSKILLNK